MSQDAKIIETKSGNYPLNREQVEALPKGFTQTPYFSERSKWNTKPSKYITRNKYNEPKAITAKQKRSMLTEV